MFEDIFEIKGSSQKAITKVNPPDFRKKLGSLLNDSLALSNYALRVSVVDQQLERILVKEPTADPHDIVALFEELRASFDSFRRQFEELDYNEVDLKEGEEGTLEDLEEQIEVLSGALVKVQKGVSIAENLRRTESHPKAPLPEE